MFRFSRCMAGVWSTKEMTPPNDKELFAQATIRELAIYCTFLIVLSMGKLQFPSHTNDKELFAQAIIRKLPSSAPS